jgi:hypothetical protein
LVINTNLMNATKNTSFAENLYQGDILTEINKKEESIKALEDQLSRQRFELQELKRKNAANTTIRWKESIRWCLEVDSDNAFFFIKNPAFVAKCIASKHGVEITRDIKNKISTTLSTMFNAGEIGRVQYKGNTYYGLTKFFEGETLESLKTKYVDRLEDLRQ